MPTKIPRRLVVDRVTRLTTLSTEQAAQHVYDRIAARRVEPSGAMSDDDFRTLFLEVHLVTKERIARLITRLKSRRPAHQFPPKISAVETKSVARLSRYGHLIDLSHDEIDIAISGIHERAPWMRGASVAAMQGARATAGAGTRLPPMLLVGPPGTGKTTWATGLAAALGLPSIVISATTRGLFALSGVESGWTTARSGDLISHMLTTGVGNPVVVIDEIDKAAGGARTTAGQAMPGIADALLEMIESATASAWSCPYLGARFDISNASWIMTANDLSRVPKPLLDRVRVIEIGPPTRSEAAEIARRRAAEKLGDEVADDVAAAVYAAHREGSFSLRSIDKLIVAASGLARPALH
ncbi:AAA family ATPase [Paracoccus yeei]|nr:AAA family ATPase [Paracoccus yeei]